MSIWIYAIPVVFILLLIVIMMPLMKKKAAQSTQDMDKIKNKKVHMSLLCGVLESVNGTPEANLEKCHHIYGLDFEGPLDVAFIPSFTAHGTTYRGHVATHVKIPSQSGKSYEIAIVEKKPKEDPDIIDVTELVSDELIFKSKFYVVTKDITGSDNAKIMRGTYS